MTLASVRARVEAARVDGGEALAAALIELAEREPLLGHRQAAVRAPLEEAAALLTTLAAASPDRPTLPALEGRALLRLAHLKLLDNDLEAVEQLAGRARERLEPAGDAERVVDAQVLVARAAVRRRTFEPAEARLTEISAALVEPTTDAGQRAAARLALAWAELALEQQQYAAATTRLEALDDLGGEELLTEIDYAGRQVRALVALVRGDHRKACQALREAVAIAKRLGAHEDELETRIALAGALTEGGDPIGREEAERHLQITRDEALAHGLDSLHMAALVGQAGVLAKKGQTQAALARCVEIAESAVAKQDLRRYGAAVALMSQIYEQRGDLASAYRTFAEAHATLKTRVGDLAKDVIRPHLAAFAERIGQATFEEIAEKVTKAAHARQAFQRTPS